MAQFGFRRIGSGLLLLGALVLLPTTASAQSAIAGTVTDATGAVLPGVTVEVKSPALIEQSRTGVTDGQGVYRIIDLRPGTYTVTFSLTGFNTVIREGIELPANFTAPVSTQLRVGALEETVTVSGASPIVDVQSTNRREVLNQDVIKALPQGRMYGPMLATLPGIVQEDFDVGGSEQLQARGASAYGANQLVHRIDGMDASTTGGGSSPITYQDQSVVAEYDVQLTGMGADTKSGGIQLNVIPREGGNQLRSEGTVLWSHPNLQSTNVTDELKAQGVEGEPQIDKVYDYAFAIGGPIVQNKLWFFSTTRHYAFDTEVFNLFHDGRVGPEGELVVDGGAVHDYTTRLTAQIDAKNKVTAYLDRGFKRKDYRGHGGLEIDSGLLRPEAAPIQTSPNTYVLQSKWTSTVTNKLLLEVGLSYNHFSLKEEFREGVATPEQFPPYGGISKLEQSTGVRYDAPFTWLDNVSHAPQYMAKASYVTGSHALKAGWQFLPARRFNNTYSYAAIVQRYNRGVPSSVILYSHPVLVETNTYNETGLFVQDSWTMKRLTMNLGLRYDQNRAWVAAQSSPAGRWVKERSFPKKYDLPDAWKDFTPRLGAAYDLFGTGKTVVKGSFGRYVQQAAQPQYNDLLDSTDTRNWTDLNRNNIAEENELGPTQNASFGLRANTNADPGLDPSFNWLSTVSVDHELMPRMGLSFSYTRRTYSGLQWTDNLATSHSDYTLLTTPDPRGNGEVLPVYNLSSAKLGQQNNLVMNSGENTQVYNGFDFSLHGRFANGAYIQGGTSTGRQVQGTCEVDNPNNLRFCNQADYDVPLQTTFKVSGVYPLPKGFQASAIYQDITGLERSIQYPVTRTLLPTLTASTVNVRLNEPGSEYRPRVRQLDLGISGTVPAGAKLRLKPRLDIFNLMNSSDVLDINDTYGPALDTPLKILAGRLIRLGLNVEF